jgi:uncharacterized protein YjbI with pentapeptide repeats
LKLKNTRFTDCQLKEVEFIEADLTQAVFENCDLIHATFERTILNGADLRTAFNFSIHPEINQLKKTKFSSAGLAGLLDRYDIEIE